MEQLLSTKFYIPPTRLKLVSRPHLVEQINQGLHRKLSLISAPAGFGKTTLVSEWVEQSRSYSKENFNAAWLSLDESDNDLVRFLSYLISAFRHAPGIDASFGDSELNMLQAPQPPSSEAILTMLINELVTISENTILVLDDYHLLSDPTIDDAFTFLIENLPPQIHLIIITRVDPQLPLARLRAGDQLNELRAGDLRFTSSEAAEFLNEAMGLALSAEDITALELRTEGWIAGLQLAAVSMQGREDNSSFITSFTGSQRLVLDYLIEEVLNQQPENVQEFLLKTAILDQLTGSLCDAVAANDDSATILETLEHANIFIVSLDEERRWYRYHYLFKDLLLLRLKQNQANQLPILHSRASLWYEAFGDTAKAFHHALEAGDYERAANIIEPISMTMIADSRLSSLRSWVFKLPDNHLAARPWLCVSGAWANLLTGQIGNVEKLLAIVDNSLANSTPSNLPDKDQIYGHVTTIRAYLVRWQEGDFERSIELSQEASKYVPEESKTVRSGLVLNQGISYRIIGNLKAAISALDEAITVASDVKNYYAALASYHSLGLARMKLGDLHQADEIYRQALQLGTKWGSGQPLPATGFAYLGLGLVLYERNEIDEAFTHLTRAIELADLVNEVSILLDATLAISQLKLSQNEITEASEALESAKAILSKSTRAEVTSQLSAQQAHLWLAQGDLAAAQRWARERETLLDNVVYYPRMPEYLDLARVLIARDEMDRVEGLLVKLRDDADANERKGDLIKILVLQTLLLQKQGDTDQAVTTLQKALILAESEGYIRTFVDEGSQMAKLLLVALDHGISPNYVNRLLSAFVDQQLEPSVSEIIQDPNSQLIEPLSEREIEVLQLVAEGLSNREIAARLFLSLNTVKAHARNIYGKLNVNNRTQAVIKAKTLGILPSN